MTLTSAPVITTLAELGHEWRHVATKHGGIIVWEGDLTDSGVYKRFRMMVQNGQIVMVTNRTKDGDMTFAKISIGSNPLTAHRQTLEQMRRDEQYKQDNKVRYQRDRRSMINLVMPK